MSMTCSKTELKSTEPSDPSRAYKGGFNIRHFCYAETKNMFLGSGMSSISLSFYTVAV